MTQEILHSSFIDLVYRNVYEAVHRTNDFLREKYDFN